jgi:ABC-type microcin C transport system duplicated ATPase subunit YejF
MIFQDPFASLNPRATIGRILTMGPIAHGMAPTEARNEARAMLDMVGLDAGAIGRYPTNSRAGSARGSATKAVRHQNRAARNRPSAVGANHQTFIPGTRP